MGSALYVSIKDKPSGLDTFMNGKPLAHAWETFDDVALALDLPNLDKLTTSAWKTPEKGLPVFEKYLAFVQVNPEKFEDAEGVIGDLQDVLRLIEAAKAGNTKWKLCLDY